MFVRLPAAVPRVAAVLLAATACTSAHPARSSTAPARAATPRGGQQLFYATTGAADGAVDAFSLRTGAAVRRVAAGQRDGMTLTGLSDGGNGSLLLTYTRGPACSSSIAGCGPRPHTCGGEVVRVGVADGRTTVLWRVGPDDLLGEAALSPDGSLLAARTSPCVPSYFNDHLVVRRLATEQSWSIGGAVARCHWLGAPHWLSDSRHLVVTYAAPTGATPYAGADGTCTTTGDNDLVEVDALRAQPAVNGIVRRPGPSCSWNSAATLGAEVYAVEACGHDIDRLDGAVRLVRLDVGLHREGSWSIGRCTDGNSLTADAVAGVLVSAYLFCTPPPAGQKARRPVTVLDRLEGDTLHRIAAASGGETAWQHLTWSAAPPATVQPPSGTVAGQVLAFGGPSPGRRFPPRRVGTVLVTSAGHRYTATYDRSGHFTLELPPGTYRLSARAFGGTTCQGRARVTAGRTTQTFVVCPVP